MVLGNNIANYRRLKSLTQVELAVAIGVSKGYIAAIEEGKKMPGIKTLAMIAECLDVELELLLLWKE